GERAVSPPSGWSVLPSAHAAFDPELSIFSPSGQVVRRDAGLAAGRRCDLSIAQAEDRHFVFELFGEGPVLTLAEPTARYLVHAKGGANMTSSARLDGHVRDVLALCRRHYDASADGVWQRFVMDYVYRYARTGTDGRVWRELTDEAGRRGWAIPAGYRLKRWRRIVKRRFGL
ncbi:MAG: hypothetical protein AAF108_11655, partial [Planctomycetota bacterium]